MDRKNFKYTERTVNAKDVCSFLLSYTTPRKGHDTVLLLHNNEETSTAKDFDLGT